MKINVIIIVFINFIQLFCAKELSLKSNEQNGNKKSKKLTESKDRYGGDMLGLEAQQPGVMRKAMSATNRLWPGGTVIYKFANNVFSQREMNFIQSAMKYIEEVSCVKFKKRTNEKGFVNIIRGNGCFSYVGRIGSSQSLSVGRGCMYKGTVIHELMHALGFYHEHMRSDRDSYLMIHLNNVLPGMKANFEKNPSNVNRLLTKFDYNSIMIYSSTAFSKNGQSTMVPKDKHYVLKEPYDKKTMTDLDALSINKMYSCP